MTQFSTTNQPETRGAGGQKKHKIIRDALMLALEREVNVEGKPTRRITQIAEKLCAKAAEGDVQAAKEIFDRVDGKPTQPLTGEDGAPLLSGITVTFVKPDGSG